jgi:formate dehydrogenase subunit gamma
VEGIEMSTVTETIVEKKGMEEEITRFDIQQVIQHSVLALSFILLVITGFPQKFSSLGISKWWVTVWGGLNNVQTVHHYAAYVIVAVSLYHLGYIFTNAVLKKHFPVDMIPSFQDAIKLIQEFAYFFGIRKERPEYGRFNWREKFDYWAIFWGMPVMAISGFILLFPKAATSFLPGWVVPTAFIAHSDEAMLALSWIVFVHIFFNHFTPGVLLNNTTMFNGKVPRQRYSRDHSLEYKRLLSAISSQKKTEPPPSTDGTQTPPLSNEQENKAPPAP